MQLKIQKYLFDIRTSIDSIEKNCIIFYKKQIYFILKQKNC